MAKLWRRGTGSKQLTLIRTAHPGAAPVPWYRQNRQGQFGSGTPCTAPDTG